MLSPEMNEETVLALLAHTGVRALVYSDEIQALADSLAGVEQDILNRYE